MDWHFISSTYKRRAVDSFRAVVSLCRPRIDRFRVQSQARTGRVIDTHRLGFGRFTEGSILWQVGIPFVCHDFLRVIVHFGQLFIQLSVYVGARFGDNWF